jgi:hypothetical protein
MSFAKFSVFLSDIFLHMGTWGRTDLVKKKQGFNKYVSSDEFLGTDLQPSDSRVELHCQGQSFSTD